MVVMLLIGTIIYNMGYFRNYKEQKNTGINSMVNLQKLTVNDIGCVNNNGTIKSINIKIDKKKLPKKFMVYKVKSVILDKDKIKEKALKFGISGDVTDDGESLCVKDKNAIFLVNKNTGSEQYLTNKMSGEAIPMTIVLDDKEYEKLAEKFLKDKGLSRSDMVFGRINTSTVTNSDANGEETVKIFRIEALFFSKPVDGIKYTGVGPKISVWFGDNAEIIGYGRIWREIEKYQEYPLEDFDQICAKIKNQEGLIYGIDSPDEYVDINNVDVILRSDPDGLKQQYVIPHYEITGKTKEKKDFKIIIPAVRDDYLNVVK